MLTFLYATISIDDIDNQYSREVSSVDQYKGMTESMFYVLMCFYQKPTFGIEIVSTINQWSQGEVQMGPGTLYTILGRFEKDGLIKEISVEGRKRTYQITPLGKDIFELELERLNRVLEVATKVRGEQDV